MESKVFTWH